jgi:microcystin-dependent protein
MSEAFLAEIRIVSFNFAPRGWAFCDGQILPINQNQSLYSLLGTVYGGDGRTTFALPDMRGRTPIHVGDNHAQGQKLGEHTHTLSIAETPQHNHVASNTSVAADNTDPAGRLFARRAGTYQPSDSNDVTMRADNLANAARGQAHNNMQPYLAVNFCIALQGLYPSPN